MLAWLPICVFTFFIWAAGRWFALLSDSFSLPMARVQNVWLFFNYILGSVVWRLILPLRDAPVVFCLTFSPCYAFGIWTGSCANDNDGRGDESCDGNWHVDKRGPIQRYRRTPRGTHKSKEKRETNGRLGTISLSIVQKGATQNGSQLRWNSLHHDAGKLKQNKKKTNNYCLNVPYIAGGIESFGISLRMIPL